MGKNIYKILGTIFMITSGLIYTTERIIEKLSGAIHAAGFASHGASVPRTFNYDGFFDNFFFWFFFLIGFLILSYGFTKTTSKLETDQLKK
ncbi:hypothetical protein [Cohnella abietis]|uniref:Uncharacterized protein n=1 Tax=Cohnella abietis TaxID=2507935 RepID=A0A3T1D718_9BACL|nr:hypothetical protein [Cohnella abietis]BBI33855.1 hypothetical protein KCTCHS21_32540 [Cohnella abietis]